MSTYLEAACAALEVEQEQIAGIAETPDALVVLVDYGIGGIKKYRLDYEALMPPEPEAPDLHKLRKAELQEIAVDEGIDVEGLTVKRLIAAIEDAWAD